ncbi:MAG: hypothetical protein IJP94_08895 [Clostridia bacterium]|nr:hypothetical protein [Ruminococcus sp.]MBR0089942.1 hypothetical protein [Clostridia bacterium]
MTENIYHEINNPYPTYIDFYMHEFDRYTLNIYFMKEGSAFDVDVSDEGSYEATFSITIDKIIVCDNISAGATEDSKGIKIDFRSSNFKLIPGLMKIEISIKEKSASNNQDSAAETQKTICPICPINIKVKASILDESSGTLESVGSISELLSMLTSIHSLIDNSARANLGSISKSTFDNLDLTVGVVYTAGLTQGFLYTNSPGQSAMIIAVATNYTIIISALDGVFYVYGAAGARGECEGAVGGNSLVNGSVKSSKIPNYTIGFSQLTQSLQDTINEHTMKISALEETIGTINDDMQSVINEGV